MKQNEVQQQSNVLKTNTNKTGMCPRSQKYRGAGPFLQKWYISTPLLDWIALHEPPRTFKPLKVKITPPLLFRCPHMPVLLHSCFYLPQPGCMWDGLRQGKVAVDMGRGIPSPYLLLGDGARRGETTFLPCCCHCLHPQMNPLPTQHHWGEQKQLWCFPCSQTCGKTAAAGWGERREREGGYYTCFRNLNIQAPGDSQGGSCLHSCRGRRLGVRGASTPAVTFAAPESHFGKSWIHACQDIHAYVPV